MDLPIYRPQHLNILRRIRERRITLVVLTILCSIAFTVCRFANHEIADEYRRRGDRCVAEMNTIQQQLQIITEYKMKNDKLLNECNSIRNDQDAKYKETMDSCAAIKQAVAMCQHQFEDLTGQCKKLKINLDNLQRELDKSNNT